MPQMPKIHKTACLSFKDAEVLFFDTSKFQRDTNTVTLDDLTEYLGNCFKIFIEENYRFVDFDKVDTSNITEEFKVYLIDTAFKVLPDKEYWDFLYKIKVSVSGGKYDIKEPYHCYTIKIEIAKQDPGHYLGRVFELVGDSKLSIFIDKEHKKKLKDDYHESGWV